MKMKTKNDLNIVHLIKTVKKLQATTAALLNDNKPLLMNAKCRYYKNICVDRDSDYCSSHDENTNIHLKRYFR